MKPLKGRLEILVPNGGLNTHRSEGKNIFTDFRICSYVFFFQRGKRISPMHCVRFSGFCWFSWHFLYFHLLTGGLI